jgi:lipopolysaccharide/colanic/teichoic acid biosynthesis glycosyltransferase
MLQTFNLPLNRNRFFLKLLDQWHGILLAIWMVRVSAKLGFSAHFKRSMDVLGAGGLLLLLSPALLPIAILIKLDGGPVFYAQRRVGQDGRLFRFWKFRSMVVNADQLKQQLMEQNQMQGGVLFKMRRDPRVTTVGRFLRRTSLDEIPQLWNVVRGDMSLVGPRPALPDEVMAYDSRACRRLSVPQGITCLWQVKGRNLIGFHGQVALDLEYATSKGIFNDIKILAATLPAVVSGKGAY